MRGTNTTANQIHYLQLFLILIFLSSSQFIRAQSPGGVSSGLQVWLKADAGFTYNSAANAEWLDQSANALILNANLVQGPDTDSAPTFLANSTNFNPGIIFDGVDNGLSTALNAADFNFSETTVFTAQQVLANTTSTSNTTWHYSVSGGNDFALFDYPDDYGFQIELTGHAPISVANTILNNDLPHLFGFTGSSSSTELYLNDKVIATSTGMTTLPGNGAFMIGIDADGNQAQDGNNHLEGAIGEIVMFDRKLSATEQQQVNSYLALKYGIALDQTLATDYLASDGTTIIWGNDSDGFTTDIFGMGRDDNSGLNQKVSKSVNPGAILSLALDNDFTAENTNASRSTIHTNDKQFIMVAHNGDAITAQTTELDAISGFNLRLAREWKIDNTNFAQNVSMQFEGYDESWSVIASANGNFSAGVATMGTLNANGEFTTSAPPTDGLVFTLAKLQEGPGGQLADLTLWLKADADVLDSGNTLTGWSDQTSTNVFSVSGDPQTNTTNLNFNNTINFDGSGDYLTGDAAIDFKNGYAVFKVLNPGGADQGTLLSSTSTGTGNSGYYFKNRPLSAGDNSTDGDLTYVTTNGNMGVDFHIANMDIIDGQSVTSTIAFLDGLPLTSSLLSGSGNMGVHNSVPYIGRSQNNSIPDYLNGEVAEIIMYSSSHTNLQRNQIQSYLALKYGITLDQTSATDYLASDGTTKIWAAADNTGYANAIFGIGRDDASGLNQKVSKSINDGAVLTMALDNDFTSSNSNASRTSTHINDQQFLVIASDGGATTNQTTEIDINTHAARIGREWKVDKTANFTQDINLKFIGFDDTWELMKDSDGDFSASATSVGILDANGEISGITLADGDYFTLHTNGAAPTILSYSPVLSGNGDIVTIVGNGFIGTTAVTFGGVAASSFTVVSGTEITAVVGTGSSGDIQVTNPQGNDTEIGFIYKVAEYEFENDVLDSTDNNHDGTEINTVTYETGAQGQALCFDNDPGFVELPDNLIRNLPQFTISLRFKTTGTGAILGYQSNNPLVDGGNYIPIIMLTDDGKLKGTLWTSSGSIQAISTNPVNDGNWHQVDFTASTNTVTIYLDGTIEASATGASVSHLNMSINQLGLAQTNGYNNGNTDWEYFDGCIDDMVIIDRALTAQELEDITALPEPTITSFTPTEAGEEDTVVITGTNFDGATQVAFGSTDVTSYTVDSATQITAVIGTGATGNIAVTTAGGTVTANGFTFNADSFTVSETTLTLDENAGTNTFTVVLDTEPSSDVVFDISSDDTDEATVNAAQLTFTNANWDTPQTVTISGVDDAIERNDFATITVVINDAGSDDPFDALADQTVAITLTDDDDAGFTLSETTLTIDEAGGTGTFTVVVNSEPVSDVLFDISSDDTDEATVSAAQLTFTSANWNTPQTIIVTGVNDDIDRNDSATITIAINGAGSDDTYDALANQTVAITLTDDDTVGYTVSETTLTIDENAGTGTFTIVLDTEPASNVVFNISSDDTDQATVDSALLTFTTANWNIPQMITVTGVNDDTNAADSALITVSVVDSSSDDSYDTLSDQTVAITLQDTTKPEITLTGADPQTIELGAGYDELGATIDDDSSITIDISNFTDAVGNYAITYDATDASGNNADQVTRTVNVVDTTKPVITLNGSNPQTIELGNGYAELGATADDGSTVAIDTSNFVDAVGSYSIMYDATDVSGNNADQVTRTVNVVDTTEPVITLNGSNPQTIELGDGYAELGAIADDGSTVTIDTSNFVDAVGSHSIMYDATDASGNDADQVTRTVNVVDTTEPVITLNGSNPQTIELGDGYAELGATADDGSTVTIDASNFVDAVGSYLIIYGVTDTSGNNADQVTRTVNVVDMTKPVITLNGVTPQTIELGDGYVELGATADDGSTVTIVTSNFVDAVGSYSIIYDATDASGNDADQVTRTVNVVDTTEPVITLNGANPQTIELGDGYTELGATADDGSTVTIYTSNFVDAVGSYSITYAATDASGNTADQVTRTVIVVSTKADTDNDGIPDDEDVDDDNDGTPDFEDAFPLDENEDTDTDGDGIGDNADSDDDNDGIPDDEDADVNGDGTVDNGTDSDGDGINDANDTIDDSVDSDGDGVPDVDDAFPNNPNESIDIDGDGVGANADTDDNDADVGEVLDVISAEAITPNGDGINDTWIIRGIENHPNAVVSVYNRYGHEVFKAIDYQNDWSGRYSSRSENLPAGSYYYVIDFRNGSAPMDGWIFINY
tara:strand:- start:7112 stop:13801 length:6690 start_codon:yes stop_codon:yes gene_type:complete